MVYDTIIIGAGVAGITAAIYASRKRMNFELISSNLGGQTLISGEISNYPGLIKTTGNEFNKILREQLKFNNITVKLETIIKIQKKNKHFIVISDKNKYETKTIIFATGSSPKKLNIPGENKFINKGITYCSLCDGPLFAGKEVVIIGSGNSALDAVNFLENIASKIYMMVKGDKLTGDKSLIENIKNNPKLKIIFNANITEIFGDKFVKGIKYTQNNKQNELKVEGVVIDIGRAPNTHFVEGLVKLDSDKHILMDYQGYTNAPGIFAAGACASGHEYQYIIAAGQGCIALINAAKYLSTSD